MDDLSHPDAAVALALKDIRRVNSWLGGHRVGMAGLRPYLKTGSPPVHILDMGCGDGEFLRHVSQYCQRSGIPVTLTGWDRNPGSLERGRQMAGGGDLQLECRDITAFPHLPNGNLVVVCNLFLHHFSDEEILEMLRRWRNGGCRAIVVNDLHRNLWAHSLFRLFGVIFMKSKMARHDGLVSIRRGFKREELEQFGNRLGVKAKIRWKWAFRFLWVLEFEENG